MKTMSAIVKKQPGVGLSLADVPVPGADPHSVLIRVLRSSICGTDVHIYNWDEWAQRTIKPPLVIGHEFVGRVEQVGQHVEDIVAGDLVNVEGHLVCGRCRNCLAGRRHLCRSALGIGVNRDGAFAEYIAVPAANVWRTDSKIPLEVLSCFDPLGNAVHTALSFNLFGEDILITGAGPIGIMAVAVARKAGARFVVITDVNPDRLELARKMEPTRVVDSSATSLRDVMRELGMKEGFDVGLEMSGSPRALNDMLEVMFHGGKIAMLGIQPSSTAIDWHKVVFNGLTIKGIYGREMFETWYKMTAMIQSGLDIRPVITHVLDHRDFEEGFQLMRSGKCGKVVLRWAE